MVLLVGRTNSLGRIKELIQATKTHQTTMIRNIKRAGGNTAGPLAAPLIVAHPELGVDAGCAFIIKRII